MEAALFNISLLILYYLIGYYAATWGYHSSFKQLEKSFNQNQRLKIGNEWYAIEKEEAQASHSFMYSKERILRIVLSFGSIFAIYLAVITAPNFLLLYVIVYVFLCRWIMQHFVKNEWDHIAHNNHPVQFKNRWYRFVKYSSAQ